MDLTKLAGTLLSSDSISGLSNLTGASDKEVSNVLAQALPALLSGANSQAKDKDTAESFATALSDHAKDDTKDLSKFLGNVDLKDGAKILTHLLGSDKDDLIGNIAESTGVSQKDTSSIVSAIAPLLLSLLGQQANEDEDQETGAAGLVGALLENVDVGSLLTGLLTDNTSSSSSTSSGSTGKKKKSKKKKASDDSSSNLLGSIISGLLKK